MADPSLSAPVAKALLRLQTALDAGAAYEGQQVAKAAAARMRSRGSKEEAADLLGRAAEAQLRAGQITCGSELALNLLEDYEKAGVKLPGDVKASPSGEMPEQAEGPPAAIARLLRILDAFSSSSSSGDASAAPSSSSSSRPDATSALVAAVRFASAATKWAGGAGGGKELLGKLHLACAAALSAAAASPSPQAGEAAAASASSGPAAAWGAAAPHWARASAASPETVAQALDAAARQGGPEGGEKERSAFLARAALAQVAARAGSSPHEAADAVKGAQQLAEEFRRLSTSTKKDALDSFLDLFLESLAKGSPPLASLAAREYGPLVESVPGLSNCVDAAGSAAFEAIFGSSGGGGGGSTDMGGLGGLAALLGGGGGGGVSGGGGAPDLGAMLGAMLGGGGGAGGGGAGGGLGDLMAMLGGGGR